MTTIDLDALFKLAQAGNTASLARIISLIERGDAQGKQLAKIGFATQNDALSVGITGAPGSGKSTLTSALLDVIRASGKEVAVLAVDPSSPFSGGAILGDRVRMQDHSLDKGVFIRSMATRGHQGGLAVAVPEVTRILGAVGFPIILIETVGVGQVEVEIAQEADTVVVVVNPGWGDSIQANKAGLLEIADIFIINKSDKTGAREVRRDLEAMLDLSNLGSYRPPIIETSATEKSGIQESWDAVVAHQIYSTTSGLFEIRRQRRIENELKRLLRGLVESNLNEILSTRETLGEIKGMLEGKIDPETLARQLYRKILSSDKH